MKKIVLILAAVCMIFPLTACNMDSDEVHSFLNGLAENLGDSQITEDKDLIGTRALADDAYTGTYQADCGGNTGRDVVFGGGSIDIRKIHVYGTIHRDSGNAVVRIRLNEEVNELSVQDDGSFETDLSCTSGGNYIMVDYEDFQGSVELNAEYELVNQNRSTESCMAKYVAVAARR